MMMDLRPVSESERLSKNFIPTPCMNRRVGSSLSTFSTSLHSGSAMPSPPLVNTRLTPSGPRTACDFTWGESEFLLRIGRQGGRRTGGGPPHVRARAVHLDGSAAGGDSGAVRLARIV